MRGADVNLDEKNFIFPNKREKCGDYELIFPFNKTSENLAVVINAAG